MEQYIVIAKRLEGGKDKFEDYRIIKLIDAAPPVSPPTSPVEPPLPVDFEKVFGPAGLDKCVNYIKEKSVAAGDGTSGGTSGGTGGARASTGNPRDDKDPRWFWVSVGQNFLLGLVAVALIYILYYGLKRHFLSGGNITPDDNSRNLITFLVAFGTIFIGVLGALTAMFTRDTDRIAGVKDIFTVLVGILGTIIGFYFGSTTDNNNPTNGAPQITVSEPVFNPTTLVPGGTAGVSFTLTGGKAPYHYIMTFPDASDPKVVEKDSTDGKVVNEQFTVPTGIATSVDYVIEGKDNDNKTFKYVSQKDVPVQP
jgi:hypothetical protein